LEEKEMRKVVAMMAVLGMAAVPALADIAPIQITKGMYTYQPVDVGGNRGLDPNNVAGIYNNLQIGNAQTQYRIPNNQGMMVGDDLHMTGNVVTGVRWVYSDPGVGSHTSLVGFFNQDGSDTGPVAGNTATFTSLGSTYAALFSITGLPNATPGNPGGGWLITVGLPSIPTTNDIWIGFQSNSLTAPNPANMGLRGTNLVPGPGEGVGSSHNLHWSGFNTTPPYTTFFPHAGGGNFRVNVLGTPEPAVACLLALGGLVVLRRRKQK
jgi:hypothetical protein